MRYHRLKHPIGALSTRPSLTSDDSNAKIKRMITVVADYPPALSLSLSFFLFLNRFSLRLQLLCIVVMVSRQSSQRHDEGSTVQP